MRLLMYVLIHRIITPLIPFISHFIAISIPRLLLLSVYAVILVSLPSYYIPIYSIVIY